MAENSSNRVGWLLELRRKHIDWLANIRHWSHLKVATEGESMWVSGFSDDEIVSTAIRSIPAKKIWQQKGDQLFPQGSRLPYRKAPMLLWTPIERGLPLTLPDENHNFFGIKDQAPVRLLRTDEVNAAVAMITPLARLQSFIENAAAVRLKKLQWVLIGQESALVYGTPLLPVPGHSFWQSGNFLIPAGYDFEWPVMMATLRSMMASIPNELIVWNSAGSWFRVPGAALRPLTIGSFRQSALLLRATTDRTS